MHHSHTHAKESYSFSSMQSIFAFAHLFVGAHLHAHQHKCSHILHTFVPRTQHHHSSPHLSSQQHITASYKHARSSIRKKCQPGSAIVARDERHCNIPCNALQHALQHTKTNIHSTQYKQAQLSRAMDICLSLATNPHHRRQFCFFHIIAAHHSWGKRARCGVGKFHKPSPLFCHCFLCRCMWIVTE